MNRKGKQKKKKKKKKKNRVQYDVVSIYFYGNAEKKRSCPRFIQFKHLDAITRPITQV
jgi:hypothetical protein